MGDPVTINLRHVARGLSVPLGQVQAAVELLDDGNTVPFITRYRKDQTGGLDEEQIRQIQDRLTKLRLLAERKQTVLRSIESQGKLTEKLAKQILAANTTKRLEDLYLPYRPKKQTLATLARSRGLEPLAAEILAAEPSCADLDARAADFVNPDRQVPTAADALLGVGHILAEQFSERVDLRQRLREILHRSGKLASSEIDGESKPQAVKADKAQKAEPPQNASESAGTEAPQLPETPAGPQPAETTPQASRQAAQPPVQSTGTEQPAETQPEAEPPPGTHSQPPPESQREVEQPPQPQAEAEREHEPQGEAPQSPESETEVPPAEPSPGEVPPATEPLAGSGQTPPPQTQTEPPDRPQTEAQPPPETQPPSQSTTEVPHEVKEPAQKQAPNEPTNPPPGEVPNPGEPEADVPNPGEPEADAPNSAEPEADVPNSAEPEADAPNPGEPRADVPNSAEPQAEVPNSGEPEADLQQPAQPQAEAEPPTQAESAPPDATQPQTPAPTAPQVRQKRAPVERRRGKKELKKKKAEEKLHKAFRDYYDYREEIKKIPPHRVLAINRGERAKVLRVKIEADLEAMYRAAEELCVPADHPHAEFLRGCARGALARLILPSLEREIRRELTDRAEAHAVSVFARNLRNLLLQPPIRERRVLAVDPGYRSGCKLAALDQFGNMLAHGVIYLVGKPERREDAKRIVAELINRFELTVVTIGNGTACREAEEFFAALIADDPQAGDLSYVIVNEAGASVYSTSRLGREEFPQYDASLRGAISIGRRLQDPLSELVKIDPASIGVGLYQHDVKAKHLRTSLDEVVESCVNYVGVDLNTASPALLRYVSGLNQLTARRLYEHRLEHGPFRDRQQLRDVPGFGEATFVQAAGFLKIASGDDPLDATWIHPESYPVASQVMDKLGCTPADFAQKETSEKLAERIRQVDVPALAKELQAGELSLRDILAQLARPGRDPREDLPGPVFKQGILKLEDLNPGMELTGTVLNVVDFGAFVDIGMHDSGLVHVSQLADKFVRDPHEVVAVGGVVRVWVVEVDKQRRRVSLTMIPPGTQRAASRREGKAPGRRPPDRDRPTRHEGKPKPRGPRAKTKGPPKPKYRPRTRRKPVIPITNDMKVGKEPLRSFSDLAQFVEAQEPEPAKDQKKAQPQPAKDKPRARDRQGQQAEDVKQDLPPEQKTTQDEAQAPRAESQPAPAEPQVPDSQEPPQPQAEAPQDTSAGPPAESPPPESPAADDQAQSTQDEPPPGEEPPQSTAP